MSDNSIMVALCLECGRTRPFKPGRGTAEQRWVAVYAAAIVYEYTSAGRLGADVADPVNWARWAEEAATVADLAEEGFATLDAPMATPPDDGGPAMRPHSIPGWWQVWQGGICVALLRPEDVAALAEVPRG